VTQVRRLVLPALRDPAILDRGLFLFVRCFGAGTTLASMIWPPKARYPLSVNTASKRAKSFSIARAFIRRSRNNQIVVASGTAPSRPSPRKRRKESRSLI
jgi:hypothetical protein